MFDSKKKRLSRSAATCAQPVLAGLSVLTLLLLPLAAGCRGPESDADTYASQEKLAPIYQPRGEIEPDELSAIRDFLTERIEAEIEGKEIPAISIGLFDTQGALWADGFGAARVDGTPASRKTVYRVGSVSKLFTDIAVMQRVERGELDLDAPITDVLPEFLPDNSFGVPITLRQLMCHRAGLVREPPVGNYFDDDGTSLAATVASLNQTSLVHEPGTVTKYSNAGIAVVGYVLEKLAGVPFEQAVRDAVLGPLEMSHSDFLPSDRVSGMLADAQMRTIDARRFEAPTFQLGMSPAGSLYSTIDDLALFTRALLLRETVLQEDSFEEMFTPQFADKGVRAGYGLGFRVSTLDESDGSEAEGAVRRLGHGGAIYGFSTQLEFLPEAGLGVAVTANLDLSNGTVGRIANEALEALLIASRGAADDTLGGDGTLASRLASFRAEVPQALSQDQIESLAGTYLLDAASGAEGASIPQRVQVLRRRGGLTLDTGRSVARLSQRQEAGEVLLIQDDPGGRGRVIGLAVVEGLQPVLSIGEARFRRAEPGQADLTPAPSPGRFLDAIGEYGEDHNPLFLYEHEGQLWALIEWLERTPLHQLDDDSTFAIDSGMYVGEQLTLTRGSDGAVEAVRLGPVVFERRDVGTANGETFRITPIRPVPELRADALAATPPDEGKEFSASDLVELTALDPSIELDVRYATTNNFMSTVFYDEPRAFLQRPAAEAVVRANKKLRQQGYGLLIHDAYRPWYVTKMFWDATPEDKKIFVADPSSGSRHNRGCAVDLTLFDLATGQPVQMVGGYDEMTDRSFPDYLGGTEHQRFLRQLLRDAMDAEGFEVYEFEWWHFDYRDWQNYGIQNDTFDQL